RPGGNVTGLFLDFPKCSAKCQACASYALSYHAFSPRLAMLCHPARLRAPRSHPHTHHGWRRAGHATGTCARKRNLHAAMQNYSRAMRRRGCCSSGAGVTAELKTSVDALRKIEQAIRRDFMDLANEQKRAEKGDYRH